MEKEVDDIIHDCMRPNFVELPKVFEKLPNPTVRGENHVHDTEAEHGLLSTEEEYIFQNNDNGTQVTTNTCINYFQNEENNCV